MSVDREPRDFQAIRVELFEDEQVRDSSKFIYSADILREGGLAPDVIWPEPNGVVRKIIAGEVTYDELYDGSDEMVSNEFHKAGLFREQKEFVAAHLDQEALCEAVLAFEKVAHCILPQEQKIQKVMLLLR